MKKGLTDTSRHSAPLGGKAPEKCMKLPPSRPTHTAALKKMGLLGKDKAPHAAKEY